MKRSVKGTIKNNSVVFTENVDFADGTQVIIDIRKEDEKYSVDRLVQFMKSHKTFDESEWDQIAKRIYQTRTVSGHFAQE